MTGILETRRSRTCRETQGARHPVKPLNDEVLGAGYMRVTTVLPEDNARFVAAPKELL